MKMITIEIKRDVLKLETICYESIYDNRKKLQFQIIDIPRNLFKIIDHMIKFREARDTHKKIENAICFYKIYI